MQARHVQCSHATQVTLRLTICVLRNPHKIHLSPLAVNLEDKFILMDLGIRAQLTQILPLVRPLILVCPVVMEVS